MNLTALSTIGAWQPSMCRLKRFVVRPAVSVAPWTGDSSLRSLRGEDTLARSAAALCKENDFMASSPPLSILDVERLLEEKKSQIEELVAKREKLQKQILDLDQQMHDAASLQGPQRRRRGKPRLANTASLRTFVLNVLKKHKKGLLASEVTEKVIAAGYQTQSNNFHNVVYQCLYHTPAIEQDPASKRYSLAK
jgi:hypothetical protein